MFYKRRPADRKPGAPLWMVTYSDLATLLLIFFILLFAFSDLDMERFQKFSDSFRNRQMIDYHPSLVPLESPGRIQEFNDSTEQGNLQERPLSGSEQKRRTELERLGEKELENQRELAEVLRVVNVFLKENNLQGVVTATKNERGVVLVLQDKVLFHSGEAEILPDALPLLDRVADLIDRLPNRMIVEGHTDNVPMSSYRYPSNWELSSARASQVVRYFIEQKNLEPSRFMAIGYAEYMPVAENDTDVGRQQNRRVVIIISNTDSGDYEGGQ